MNPNDFICPSMTQQLPLEEFITRLQQQDEIDGILLAGTTGKETLKPYSDYDLVIVLNDMPITPSLIITTIEGYLAELYFLKASTLDEMLANPTTVEANSLLGAFTSMTVRGEIVYDASGKLTQLRTIADDTHYADILDHQVYSSWYSVTYNHAQNLRYYHSQDPLYLDALQCRLLYCVSNALSAYFTLRRLPWRGEKEAIRYLRENDPSYWDVFQACVNASGVHQQFERYTTLIDATLPDSMSIWGDDYTVIQPHAHLTEESINQHQAIWKQWMTK